MAVVALTVGVAALALGVPTGAQPMAAAGEVRYPPTSATTTTAPPTTTTTTVPPTTTSTTTTTTTTTTSTTVAPTTTTPAPTTTTPAPTTTVPGTTTTIVPGTTTTTTPGTETTTTTTVAPTTTTTTTTPGTPTTTVPGTDFPPFPGEGVISPVPSLLDDDVQIIGPGDVVTDGVLTFELPPDGLLLLSADGLAPNGSVRLSSTIQQLVGEFALLGDAFSPGSPSEVPNFSSTGRRPFNPGVLRSAGVDGVETELGVVLERSRAAELSPIARGASVVGATRVSASYDEFLAALGDTVGLPGLPLDEERTSEILGRGLTPFDVFPTLAADDPLLTEATDWLVVDVVATDVLAGSTVQVVWFSDPLVASAALVGADGDVAFQVHVPNTAISVGEVDRLRIYTTYELTTVQADGDGRLALEVSLPDDLRAIAEPGSDAVITAVAFDPDGAVRNLSVKVPIDALGEADSAAGFNAWILTPLVIVAAAIVFFLIARRRSGGDSDDSDDSSSGGPAIGSPPPGSPFPPPG